MHLIKCAYTKSFLAAKCTPKPSIESLVHVCVFVLVSAPVLRSFYAYGDRTCTVGSVDCHLPLTTGQEMCMSTGANATVGTLDDVAFVKRHCRVRNRVSKR